MNDLQGLRDAFDAAAFGSRYGLRCESVEPGCFASVLAIEPRHQIENATFVHGGCLAAICEQTNRFAARTLRPGATTTTELQLNYLAGASGDALRCRAAVVAVGPYGAVVDAAVHTGTGKPQLLVASCRSRIALEAPAAPAWPEAVPDRALRPDPAPADEGWRRWIREDFGQGWRRFCGIHPVDAGHGYVELHQRVGAAHLDAEGHVLPELIAPFADVAGGACAYTTGAEDERMATLDITLSLLGRPLRARALVGRARAIKVGKRVVVSRADVFGVTDEGERLLATALVTVTRVPGHQRILAGGAEAARPLAAP
jgi:acyl-coenzyme A thioesterase PaaI-like protein